jgi:hypothetical protein
MQPPSPLIASAIAKRFESNSNRQKQHRKSPPQSQTPFTKRPIKSQQQHNINGGTNATINMKKAQKQHTYRSRSYCRRLCLRGGGFGPPGAVDLLGVAVDMVDVVLSTDFLMEMRAVGWRGPRVG